MKPFKPEPEPKSKKGEMWDTFKRGAKKLGHNIGQAGKKAGESLSEGAKNVEKRGGPKLPGQMNEGETERNQPYVPGFAPPASDDEDSEEEMKREAYVPKTLFDE